MRNILIICVLCVTGCHNQSVFTVEDRAGLAAHLSLDLVVNSNKVPDNKPDLKPGDKCPECGGRGKQGDGTIEFPCKACNGTGKVLPKTSNIFTRELNEATVQLTWPPRRLPDVNDKTLAEAQSKSQTYITEATHAVKEVSPKKQVIRRSSTRWSVGQKKFYTTEEILQHLKTEHGFDATGYDRQELEAIHDNLHNGFSAFGDK